MPVSQFWRYEDRERYRRRKAEEEAAEVVPAPTPPRTPTVTPTATPGPTRTPASPLSTLETMRARTGSSAVRPQTVRQPVERPNVPYLGTGAAPQGTEPALSAALTWAQNALGSALPAVQGAANWAEQGMANLFGEGLGIVGGWLNPENPQAERQAWDVGRAILTPPAREPAHALTYDEALAQGVIPATMTREEYVPAEPPPEWMQTLTTLVGAPARLVFGVPLQSVAALGGGLYGAARNEIGRAHV